MSARCRGYFSGQPPEFEWCGTSAFGLERGSTAIPFKEVLPALTVQSNTVPFMAICNLAHVF